MVLLRYPPPQNNETGCGAHTDCGFLTLLVQDNVQNALQIKDKAGNWIDAPQRKNCVLCNLGDMAERWTTIITKALGIVSTIGREGNVTCIPFL